MEAKITGPTEPIFCGLCVIGWINLVEHAAAGALRGHSSGFVFRYLIWKCGRRLSLRVLFQKELSGNDAETEKYEHQKAANH